MKTITFQAACFNIPTRLWYPYTSHYLSSYLKADDEICDRLDIRLPWFDYDSVIDEDLLGVDILALSCYVWTQGMSDAIGKRYKQLRPDGILIYGGPHVPERPMEYPHYVKNRPFVDVFIPGSAEETLRRCVHDILEGKRCYHERSYGHGWDNFSAHGKPLPPIRFVYPYTEPEFEKVMERIGDRKCHVVMETNRGCPYKCAFCDWGSLTASKVYKFDIEKAKESFDNIVRYQNINVIAIADANFGMLKRDVEFMRHVIKSARFRSGDIMINYSMAKAPTKSLKDLLELVAKEKNFYIQSGLNSGIQSHNPDVLDIIERKNVPYEIIREYFKDIDYRPMTDLIIGLPGETLQSWISGFEKEKEMNTRYTRVFQLLVLPNAPFGSIEYQRRHGMIVRRINLPLSGFLAESHQYYFNEDRNIDDGIYTEIGALVETDSYSREDLLEMHRFNAWWYYLMNSQILREYVFGDDKSVEWHYNYMLDNLDKMPFWEDTIEKYVGDIKEIVLGNKPMTISRLGLFASFMRHPYRHLHTFFNLETALDELRQIYTDLSIGEPWPDNDATRRYVSAHGILFKHDGLAVR